jgi:hypothetical protein
MAAIVDRFTCGLGCGSFLAFPPTLFPNGTEAHIVTTPSGNINQVFNPHNGPAQTFNNH